MSISSFHPNLNHTTTLPSQQSPQQNLIQKPQLSYWQKAANFATQSVTSIASSALVGFIGTTLAEYSLNGANKLLSLSGLTGPAEYYHLNPLGMAAFTAATVPVFAITNTIFQKAVYNDGVEKSPTFKIDDAKRMGQAALQTYGGLKILEYGYNGATKFVNGQALAAGTTGVLGAFSLAQGIRDLKAIKNRRVAVAEIAGGISGLAYTLFKSYELFTTPASLVPWERTNFGALGAASCFAMVPIQLLTNQVFGCILNNSDVPIIVKKGAEIMALTAFVIASTTAAEYLGLPGASLGDPYEIFKESAYRIGGKFLLEKGLFYFIDYLSQKREEKELEIAIQNPIESLKKAESEFQDEVDQSPTSGINESDSESLSPEFKTLDLEPDIQSLENELQASDSKVQSRESSLSHREKSVQKTKSMIRSHEIESPYASFAIGTQQEGMPSKESLTQKSFLQTLEPKSSQIESKIQTLESNTQSPKLSQVSILMPENQTLDLIQA